MACSMGRQISSQNSQWADYDLLNNAGTTMLIETHARPIYSILTKGRNAIEMEHKMSSIIAFAIQFYTLK